VSNDGPEFEALEELKSVIGALTEELASWRRRALKAETQQAELAGGHDAVASRERIVALEGENADLRRRVEAARGRVQELVARLRFLEEQVALEEVKR
jgi:predicted nuclease with TOPRIM domain